MSLTEFETLLKTLGIPVYYLTGKQVERYIVYTDYSTNGLKADDRTAEQSLKVQVDFFTLNSADPVAGKIIELLDSSDITYDDPLKTYEKETRYTHHIFDCEVI